MFTEFFPLNFTENKTQCSLLLRCHLFSHGRYGLTKLWPPCPWNLNNKFAQLHVMWACIGHLDSHSKKQISLSSCLKCAVAYGVICRGILLAGHLVSQHFRFISPRDFVSLKSKPCQMEAPCSCRWSFLAFSYECYGICRQAIKNAIPWYVLCLLQGTEKVKKQIGL